VKPATVRNLARRIAKAKGCTNITQTNFSKFYHGMEMERAAILVFALAGQFGKKGRRLYRLPTTVDRQRRIFLRCLASTILADRSC